MSESIYKWIEKAPPAAEKPARYRSKYDAKSLPVPASELKAVRKPAATMGRSAKGTVDPKRFLKAGAKTGVMGASAGAGAGFTGRPQVAPPKPAVPSRHDRPVHGVKSTKNFVVANAVENILAAPKVVDRGQPDYLRKSDFGKVPAYLKEVQREIEAENEFIEGMIREHTEADAGPMPTEMPEDEREALLEALKAKWDTVNFEYQKITFKRISSSNSTAGAIRRKEECERQLAELERDIQRLSAKGPIYVYDD